MSRRRKERIEISYDVESGGALRKKELPFVVGVMGDFSGDGDKTGKPFRQRKFVDVSRDNFDTVLAATAPSVKMRVQNLLEKDDTDFAVKLDFKSIDDFHPDKIVQQVPALKALLEIRQRLQELSTTADNSEELETLLEKVLASTDSIKSLHGELDTANTGKAGDE